MLRSDYKAMARTSLNARKKTTKTTVRGIVFGLVLLIPVLFMSIGINLDLTATINKTPQSLYINVEHASIESNTASVVGVNSNDNSTRKEPFIGSDLAKSLLDLSEQTFSYDIYNANVSGGKDDPTVFVKYAIDDAELVRSNHAVQNLVSVDSVEKSKDFIGASLVDNFDAGFTGDGKGQVIVSKQFLDKNNLTPADVYNKELTIYYREKNMYINGHSAFLDDDNVVGSGDISPENFVNTFSNIREDKYLFSKFKVVGVRNNGADIGEGIYSTEPAISTYDFLVTSASMSADALERKPVVSLYEIDEWSKVALITYTTPKEDRETWGKDGYVNTGGISFTTNSSYYGQTEIWQEMGYTLIRGEDYASLTSIKTEFEKIVGDLYADNYTNRLSSMQSEVYSSFSLIYTMFTVLIIILLAFGGVIFFSAMVNLFNTIRHSVHSRKNYLGVLMAIGAQRKTIPKLYLTETYTIFKRASIWVILLGGGLCAGIKLLVDLMFTYAGESLGITIGISWGILPIALAIGFGILIGLGTMFAYGCSRGISKAHIMDILN